ncbi:MAG: Uncharacterized protein CEN92_395 [Candidatus Berkelbacteria bacterium Licking1014_96]|uniref:Uncharacterized protein n=1 Tax=Candidatus Berkelbacteria bacterium Licking1014_96 TaxID=2017149 RepID=A0A554LCX2_9BACT|nr:MAG: Uncharacterized protein CEN92_395 [Candidatus Berkelbacteria bacterium Licking1014_96]
MIEFQYHISFEKEIAALEKRRLRNLRESLSGFQKLCEVHFHPISPELRINPGKLHRVTQNDVWVMWKIELAIIKSGLRPNQYPRIWFAVSGSTIAFLCISTHIDNYKDSDMDRLALSRVADIF